MRIVPRHLKSIFAIWFVTQILLPFTAPLQTCDLAGLLGKSNQHGPVSHESDATPLTSRVESEINSAVSPLAVSASCASTWQAVVCQVTPAGLIVKKFDLPPSPQIQQTVLRV